MLSFHNDPAVKQKYLTRVRGHEAADNIIRGTGWENGKGCAVGCTLENYDHSRYPIELGVPEWLARVEDTLFEGMSVEKSHTWPRVFLESIPVGVSDSDLDRKVKAPFLVMVLKSTLDTFDHEKFPDVKSAVDGSIALWEREDIGSDEWKEAARAAADAAWAAWAADAARAARAAADAADAARAAADAAWAAWAADAAWAARAAKNDFFADELLKLLAALPAQEQGVSDE